MNLYAFINHIVTIIFRFNLSVLVTRFLVS